MKTRKNKLNNYKFYTFLTLFALLGSSFYACKKDKGQTGSANVMAVHASPDAKAASFFLDDTRISTAALNYGQSTRYVSTPSGSRKAEFRAGEENTVLASAGVDLRDNRNYTVFFAGTVAAADVVLFEDDLSAPAAGKARVRFVNLSSDATRLDFRLGGGNKIATGREYKSASNFMDVDPGTVRYEVLNNQDESVVFTTTEFSLEAGKIYTVWVKGSKNGVGDAALGAHLLTHIR